MHIVKINNGRAYISLGRKANGSYPIVSSSLTRHGQGRQLVIVPAASSHDVVNLDLISEHAVAWGGSHRVLVDRCLISTDEIQAKNLIILRVALNKLTFAAIECEEGE